MSEFKKSGNYYVSEWGGNSLNPGTAEEPFAHPADFTGSIGDIGVMGSGIYTGNRGNSPSRIHLYGDGKVMWSNVSAAITVNGGIINNIYFKDCPADGLTDRPLLQDCIFENVYKVSFKDSYGNLFLGEVIVGFFTGATMSNSLFIGEIHKSGSTSGSFSLCAFTKGSNLYISSDVGINNCLINCSVWYEGGEYELKKLFDGSPRPDADPGIPDLINVFPNIYLDGNFSGDIKLVDVLSRSVEPDSDLFKRVNNNGFIGGVKPKRLIKPTDGDFAVTKTDIDDTNPEILKILDPADYGTVRFTGRIAEELVTGLNIDARSLLAMDSSYAGGTTQNNNVPDAYPMNDEPGSVGRLPNRLCYLMRTSKNPNADPNTDSDWDNDFAGAEGQYLIHEFGTQAKHHIVDGTCYGNADPAAINAPVKNDFQHMAVDIIVILRNDRSQV